MVFQRFLDDRNASVAPLLALSIVPIIGLIGASVDYGRASSARATLQSLADSTVLAIAQDAAKASPPLTQDQVNAKASDYFNALYTHSQTDSAHMPGGAAAPVVLSAAPFLLAVGKSLAMHIRADNKRYRDSISFIHLHR